MKKLILASVSVLALFGVAACSDSADNTTTQSVNPPVEKPAAPADSTTQAPAQDGQTQMKPAPAQPAPAQ